MHHDKSNIRNRSETIVDLGTYNKLGNNPEQVISILWILGFAWRDISRMTQISVPTLKAWKDGPTISPETAMATKEERTKLVNILAICDTVSRNNTIGDIAAWFETPIPTEPATPITPIDLIEANRDELVFACLTGYPPNEEIMDAYNPNWRTQYQSDFEVFEAGDGIKSIRFKKAK